METKKDGRTFGTRNHPTEKIVRDRARLSRELPTETSRLLWLVLSLATAARGRIMSQYIFLCVMHAFPLQSPGSDMPSADLPLPGVQSMLALTASLLLAFSDVEPLTATSFTPTLARTDAAFIKVTAQKLRINLAEYLYELRDSIMQTLAQTTLALSSSHHGAPTAVRSRSLGRI